MKRSLFIILISFIFLSCGKEHNSGIPEVHVRYDITKQQFENSDQNGVLMVNNVGVAGLIIYKSINSYKAYDRCSTVNPEKRCAVVADESFTVTDPCSGAKFFLEDGSPAKPPAERSLKQYRVVTTDFQILVTNDYGN